MRLQMWFKSHRRLLLGHGDQSNQDDDTEVLCDFSEMRKLQVCEGRISQRSTEQYWQQRLF